jgi:hypothetical protein
MAMETKKKEQEEDERREELIASTPSLQPNFKAKGGITHAQLSKFQVLFRNLYSLSMLFFFFFFFFFNTNLCAILHAIEPFL